MNHRCFKKWYRCMRTTAEKRANQNCKYVRAKRHSCNLPDPWDDNPHCTQKNWKVKRSHQYRIGTRGQRHEVLTGIDNFKWPQVWNIEQYLKEHDIPYRLEPTRKMSITVAYKLVWWSDKDIGLEYILRKSRYY